jgi:hypothetical protein
MTTKRIAESDAKLLCKENKELKKKIEEMSSPNKELEDELNLAIKL